MVYAGQRLWLDDAEAERDERIGEHEGYVTLFDAANDRYLGNRLPWTEALEPFMVPELRDVIDTRFRVVARCHCDPTWCRGEEWTGLRRSILRDRYTIDFEATDKAATKEWQGHVEQLRASLDERHAKAALQYAGHLVALDHLREGDPMERLGKIRAARGVLDAVEIDAVVAARQAARSWTEIGLELGISKQAARERFMKHDPQGADAA